MKEEQHNSLARFYSRIYESLNWQKRAEIFSNQNIKTTIFSNSELKLQLPRVEDQTTFLRFKIWTIISASYKLKQQILQFRYVNYKFPLFRNWNNILLQIFHIQKLKRYFKCKKIKHFLQNKIRNKNQQELKTNTVFLKLKN